MAVYRLYMQILALLASILIVSHGQEETTPILEIKTGPIFGSVKSTNGQRYEEYLGIPFAAPPVGPLRFEKPAPPEPWTEPLNCTRYSPHCTDLLANFYPFIGFGGKNGEDCLYVNVWVPNGVQANQGRRLPVMVWVYGGGFQIGTGEMYPGNSLAVHGDLIVVNFNYRVGILGFLSTGDSEAPGNYGLWDQHAALVWVQQNIEAFNGDPSQVTIFGQSAGGVSVGHLVLSPYTQGLFRSAIAVSGAASAAWGVNDRYLEATISTAELVNCSATSSSVIVECFRGLEAKQLDFWSALSGSGFSPVVDGDFVPRPPQESFEMGIGSNINYMTGSAFHDSAGFVISNPIAFPPLGDKLNSVATNESMWRITMAMLGWTENPEELFSAIINMYPDINTSDNLTRTIAYTKANTDAAFGAFSNWEAVRHANTGGSGRTYQYMFHYRQSFLYGYPEWINGSHLDDVYSFLGEAFMEEYRNFYLKAQYNDLDKTVRDNIMDYYTNFAYTGDPNVGPKTPVVHWEEFRPLEQNFLHQSNQFHMSTFYEQNTVDLYRFWTDVFPTLVIPKPQPTYAPATETFISKFSETEILRAAEELKLRVRKSIPVMEAWKEIDIVVDEYTSNRLRLL